MKVYFIGIGGIGMSGVAALAKRLGYEVSGSDKLPLYPPASEILEKEGIPIFEPKKENIQLLNPDLVIVGNAVKRDHPEVEASLNMGKPLISFPQFLSEHIFTGKKVLVCAGTHGKTTTTALLAHALSALSQDPTYLVGGVLRETGLNYCFGRGEWAVVEGDEYPSAFFDPSPKFKQYKPFGLILTSLEYDHADAYPDFDSLVRVFNELVAEVPREGLILINQDYEILRRLAKETKARVVSYGKDPKAEFRLLKATTTFEDGRFNTRIIFKHEGGEIEVGKEGALPLPGDYNALNLIAVYALLYHLGFSEEEIIKALENFEGVKRRQEVLYAKGNIVVIDDFAHHPTAVKETFLGLKETINPERTIIIFEPRTNTSRRKVFQEDYEEVLSLADGVFIKKSPLLEKVPPQERLDLERLIQGIRRRGKKAHLLENGFLPLNQTGEKTLIVFMSSQFMREEIHNLLGLLKSYA